MAESLGEPVRSLVLLLVLTGLRIGELLALRWKNVDLSQGLLRVRETVYDGHFDEPKTKRSCREIPLGPETVGILAALHGKGTHLDALVFTGRTSLAELAECQPQDDQTCEEAIEIDFTHLDHSTVRGT